MDRWKAIKADFYEKKKLLEKFVPDLQEQVLEKGSLTLSQWNIQQNLENARSLWIVQNNFEVVPKPKTIKTDFERKKLAISFLAWGLQSL